MALSKKQLHNKKTGNKNSKKNNTKIGNKNSKKMFPAVFFV